MSLRDLSSGAGLSMGALYSYFSSKEELLRMIQDQGRRVTTRILQEQIGAFSEPKERLQTAIVVHLYLSESCSRGFIFHIWKPKIFPKRPKGKPL